MNVLITGGAGSGKSAYAEQLATSLSATRTYLATMVNTSPEASNCINRHRQQRAELDFATIECPDSLPNARRLGSRCNGVVLLDDLGNLVANALFTNEGAMNDPTLVLDRLEHEVAQLFATCAHVVVVGNEVGCEGASPYEGTRTWVHLMGSLCCRIAARADSVTEVVAGVPVAIKKPV